MEIASGEFGFVPSRKQRSCHSPLSYIRTFRQWQVSRKLQNTAFILSGSSRRFKRTLDRRFWASGYRDTSLRARSVALWLLVALPLCKSLCKCVNLHTFTHPQRLFVGSSFWSRQPPRAPWWLDCRRSAL